MKTSLLTLGLAGLALASAGCGHDDMDMDMMSDHADQLDQHMASYEDALAEHGQVISAAGSLQAMRAEETRHRQLGDRHLAGMTHEMDDMMDCNGSDEDSMHAGMLADDLDLLVAEMEAHHQAMLDASSMHDSLVEEDRHAQAMTERMTAMGSHADSMMDDMGDMACSGHM